jgi:hypothetical protein
MAEAADFSMPDVFANDYLDRIMKKRESLRLKCDNCNFCGEKTKVYTEAWNYLHVAFLNLDVKY